MAITVEEIRNKDFATEAKGYNRDEVDDFLDELAQQTEELAKDYNALKEENEKLASELAGAKQAAETAPVKLEKEDNLPTFNEPSYFKNLETTLRETLISAQRIADETIDDARKKARRIVSEAEEQAQAINEQAQQKLAETRADYENVKNAGETYHANFTKLLEEQMKLLKDSPLYTAE